jgi:HEAT repeat protein
MKLGAARRLARGLHRGQLDSAGEPFVDHLARVAAATAAAGGSRVQQLAAWLYGCEPGRLRGFGVPSAVVNLVAALSRRPYEPFESHLARALSHPGAPLVLRAVHADRCRAEALARLQPGRRDWRLREYRQILTALGDTDGLAAAPVPSDQALLGVDVPTLIATLEPAHPHRWAAVAALRQSGDRRAIPRIIEVFQRALAGDPAWTSNGYRLHQAIEEIARDPRNLADAAWTGTLVTLTRHDTPQVRGVALAALARTGDPAHQPLLRQALHSDDPVEIRAGAEGLDEAGVRAELDRLVELAGQDDWPWGAVRRAAANRLLTVADPRARAAVVEGLGLAGGAPAREVARRYRNDPGVVPDLIRILQVRPSSGWDVAYVLGELRASEAEPVLIGTLRTAGSNVSLVTSCVEALGKLGSAAAVPQLMQAAGHSYVGVRVAALQALRRLGDPRAEAVGMAATADPEPEVRAAAVRLLADRGGVAVLGHLTALTEGPHARPALRGLLRLADERAVPTLIHVLRTATDRRTRNLAGRALVRSARGRPSLYVQGWDPRVRRAEAWVLGQVADPASRQILTQALRDPDERVRARAAFGLGRIGDPAAAEPLRLALDDISPRVRANAATALGRLAVPAARTWLRVRLSDPDPGVHDASAAALRRFHR